MRNSPLWPSEAQFARLAAHLPTDTRGVPRVDDRRVISGVAQRSGATAVAFCDFELHR